MLLISNVSAPLFMLRMRICDEFSYAPPGCEMNSPRPFSLAVIPKYTCCLLNAMFSFQSTAHSPPFTMK